MCYNDFGVASAAVSAAPNPAAEPPSTVTLAVNACTVAVEDCTAPTDAPASLTDTAVCMRPSPPRIVRKALGAKPFDRF